MKDERVNRVAELASQSKRQTVEGRWRENTGNKGKSTAKLITKSLRTERIEETSAVEIWMMNGEKARNLIGYAVRECVRRQISEETIRNGRMKGTGK